MNVVLPAPLGPVRPKRRPGVKAVDTSSNRIFAPKRMETLLTEIMRNGFGGSGNGERVLPFIIEVTRRWISRKVGVGIRGPGVLQSGMGFDGVRTLSLES